MQDNIQSEFAAAVERERELRQIAFCDTLLPVAGVWVQQFTPAHWVALGLVNSPFLRGGGGLAFSREAVLQFLWIVSPEYQPGGGARQLAFFARNFGSIRPETALAIYSYLDAAFMDAPQSSGGRGKSYYSGVASLVDFFGHQYGWDSAVTMHKPLAMLFQLYNAASKRLNPDTVLFNPSDRELGRLQHERNVAAGKQGAN